MMNDDGCDQCLHCSTAPPKALRSFSKAWLVACSLTGGRIHPDVPNPFLQRPVPFIDCLPSDRNFVAGMGLLSKGTPLPWEEAK